MTDRGIIFSAPMVRAMLDERKSQTRRLGTSPLRRCVPGDRLWVRETWSGLFWSLDDIDGRAREYIDTPKAERTQLQSSGVFYKLDEDAQPAGERFHPEGQWTPSIHMPRWASRLTLTIAEVRLEPLQSITRTDAIAEGIQRAGGGMLRWEQWTGAEGQCGMSPEAAYALLWNSLHTAEGERWDDNPEVVALTFTVARKNIDA